jgi:hypothetical protein
MNRGKAGLQLDDVAAVFKVGKQSGIPGMLTPETAGEILGTDADPNKCPMTYPYDSGQRVGEKA